MTSSEAPPSGPKPADAERAADLRSVQDLFHSSLTAENFERWRAVSARPLKLLEDGFFGTIRWEKVLGRATAATLAAGFSISAEFHAIDPTSAGANDTMLPLPPVSIWDAADDDTHHAVNYWGYYRRYSGMVLANDMLIHIVGRWSRPLTLEPGYLLPYPLGFATFGTFDGSPIFFEDVTLKFYSSGLPGAGIKLGPLERL